MTVDGCAWRHTSGGIGSALHTAGAGETSDVNHKTCTTHPCHQGKVQCKHGTWMPSTKQTPHNNTTVHAPSCFCRTHARQMLTRPRSSRSGSRSCSAATPCTSPLSRTPTLWMASRGQQQSCWASLAQTTRKSWWVGHAAVQRGWCEDVPTSSCCLLCVRHCKRGAYRATEHLCHEGLQGLQ